MPKENRCRVCGRTLKSYDGPGRPPLYCDECSEYYEKEYIRKNREKNIGNPEQDIKILRHIRKNRK